MTNKKSLSKNYVRQRFFQNFIYKSLTPCFEKEESSRTAIVALKFQQIFCDFFPSSRKMFYNLHL